MREGKLAQHFQQLLFVLGRYRHGQQSYPNDLESFPVALKTDEYDHDWAVCAFGANETDCLAAAVRVGGKARIGFENSLWNKDGSLARDNAERVAELVRIIKDDLTD